MGTYTRRFLTAPCGIGPAQNAPRLAESRSPQTILRAAMAEPASAHAPPDLRQSPQAAFAAAVRSQARDVCEQFPDEVRSYMSVRRRRRHRRRCLRACPSLTISRRHGAPSACATLCYAAEHKPGQRAARTGGRGWHTGVPAAVQGAAPHDGAMGGSAGRTAALHASAVVTCCQD